MAEAIYCYKNLPKVEILKTIDGYSEWSKIELLTGLIIGEARGEINAGKIGVALTAKTRADHPRINHLPIGSPAGRE